MMLTWPVWNVRSMALKLARATRLTRRHESGHCSSSAIRITTKSTYTRQRKLSNSNTKSEASNPANASGKNTGNEVGG